MKEEQLKLKIRFSLEELVFVLSNYSSSSIVIKSKDRKRIELLRDSVGEIKFNYSKLPQEGKDNLKICYDLLVLKSKSLLKTLEKKIIKEKKKAFFSLDGKADAKKRDRKEDYKNSQTLILPSLDNFQEVDSTENLREEYCDSKFIFEWTLKSNGEVEISRCLPVIFEYHPRMEREELKRLFQLIIGRLVKNCSAKYLLIRLTLCLNEGGHANLLLIDVNKKIIERFEPHGVSSTISDYVDEYLKLPGFEYLPLEKTCPFYGPQGKDALCGSWVYLIMELKILNPNLSLRSIQELLIVKYGKNILNYCRKYTTRLRILHLLEVILLEILGRKLLSEVEDFLSCYQVTTEKFQYSDSGFLKVNFHKL